MNIKETLKPNLDKVAITLLLSLPAFLLYVLLFHPEPIHASIFLLLIPLYIVASLLYRSLAKYTLLLHAVKWIVYTPLVVLVIMSAVSQVAPAKPPQDFLITKNFVDLKQIDSISKFRSCSGHRNMPQYTNEPNSSAKHYMISNVERSSGEDQVKIFAPFDGYIVHPLSQGVTVVPASTPFPWWPFNQWRFNVEPVHLVPQYENGIINKVKAGDLIGYVDDYRYRGEQGQAFFALDLVAGVTAIPPQFKDGNTEPWKRMDSVFRYMSDRVFDEYKAAIPGLESREDFVVPLKWREDHLCKYGSGGGPYFDNGKPEDRIIEEQDVYLGIGIKDLTNIKDATNHCSSQNLWGRPSCVGSTSNETIIHSYSCPDSMERRKDLPTLAVKNGVEREIGKDEQDWISKNCNLPGY